MHNSNTLLIFTDGSVNTNTNVGFGAYLAISENEIHYHDLNEKLKIRRFEDTSSSKLELQTVLWVLTEVPNISCKIILFTDSQTILGLPLRRERLEKGNYFSKQNKLISNSELYQQFFKMTDELDCEFVKIKGHKKTHLKDNIDRLFTLVDRASRNAMRGEESLE